MDRKTRRIMYGTYGTGHEHCALCVPGAATLHRNIDCAPHLIYISAGIRAEGKGHRLRAGSTSREVRSYARANLR